MQNWSGMMWWKYHKSFKAVSSHPRMQDNHNISPLTPFQFLFRRQYRAFSLELCWWQACFNTQFCWSSSLLLLSAVAPSFLPTRPPEQNDGFPPLDIMSYKCMLLEIHWWSTVWALQISKFLYSNCPHLPSCILSLNHIVHPRLQL